MKKKEIIIIGGGHAKVLIDAILSSGSFRIKGTLDPSLEKGSKVAGYPVLGPDNLLDGLKGVSLANGIGAVKAGEKRKNI